MFGACLLDANTKLWARREKVKSRDTPLLLGLLFCGTVVTGTNMECLTLRQEVCAPVVRPGAVAKAQGRREERDFTSGGWARSLCLVSLAYSIAKTMINPPLQCICLEPIFYAYGGQH